MRTLIFLIGILIVTSCAKNIVYFDKPQPENIKDLKTLPNRYQGKYINADSSFLNIDKNLITKSSQFELYMSKLEIDTNPDYYIENNFLVNRLTKEKFNIQIIKDSVIVKGTQSDTLFRLSSDNIARKFKGYLIISIREDDLWRVEIFSLKRKVLQHMMINSKELFTQLSAITESEVVTDSAKKDTLRMIIRPTKAEFKKILALQDSLLIDVYKKIE